MFQLIPESTKSWLFLASLAVFFTNIHHTQAQTATWQGGSTGIWNDFENWSGGEVPNGSGFDVFIDSNGNVSSEVDLDTTVSIGSLTLDDGDELNFLDGFNMTVIGGSMLNNGLMSIRGNDSLGSSQLYFINGGQINGSGAIALESQQGFSILSSGGSNALLINGANHEIFGEGTIGNGTGEFLNQGIIAVSQGSMQINPLSFENAGEIFVSNAVLQIDTDFVQSTGATYIHNSTINATTLLLFNGGILDGSGFINGDVALGGTVRPGLGLINAGAPDGNPPSGLGCGSNGTTGNLSFQDLELLDTAVAEMELGGLNSGEFDALFTDGNLILDGDLCLSFVSDFQTNIQSTDVISIMQAGAEVGFLSGGFDNVGNGDFLLTSDGFGKFQVFYGAGSPFGIDSVVLANFSAVPEPTAGTLLVLAAIVGTGLRRRRNPDFR